jgi:cytochrome c oxidase subunit 3
MASALTPATAWGIPAVNTLILLTSAGMVTWAHWGLAKGRRWQMKLGLLVAILLGLTFLILQAHEYLNAAFTLKTGIYGATFFMLTGFHGAHVIVGSIFLGVVLLRTLAGHFAPGNAFGFEAASWYWHFVDVVWLFLFVFVYWL